jgi:hypothetical protein
MRAFWAILGVLMLAAAAYLMVSPRHAPDPEAAVTAPAVTPAPGDPRQVAADAETATQELQPPPPPAAPPLGESTTAAPLPAAQPPGAQVPVLQAPVAPAPSSPLILAPEPSAAGAEAPPGTAGVSPSAHEPAAAAGDEATAPITPPLPEAPAVAAAPPAPAEPDPKIEKQPDGSLLVDGKYTVTGSGTEADPYKVTWDQLVSVQSEYAPKDGRTRIPGRATMLDGKWVQITGNIAFPLMAESDDECLSMLNRWDGCCIGIPPTPYDAIEVRLKNPAEGKDRLATYGVIKGRMKVEPALVGGWLTGLYLMERATMTPQG